MKTTKVHAKTNAKSKREELRPRRGVMTNTVEQTLLWPIDISSMTWVQLGIVDGSGGVLKINDSSDSSRTSISSTWTASSSQWELLAMWGSVSSTVNGLQL